MLMATRIASSIRCFHGGHAYLTRLVKMLVLRKLARAPVPGQGISRYRARGRECTLPAMIRAGSAIGTERGFVVPPIAPLLDEYTGRAAAARTPAEVLDAMDAFAKRILPVNVLG